MTERKIANIFTLQGNVSIGVEIDPHEVRLYDTDGDLAASFPVPGAVAEAAKASRPAEPSPPDPLQARFALATQGEDPEFDALGILTKVLKPLDPEQRDRVLFYLTERYASADARRRP